MKLQKPTTKLAALISAAALALTACGGGGTSDQKTASDIQTADYNPQDRDNIKDGGTLTTGIGELSEQENPFHADGTAYTTSLWRWYNPWTVHYSPEGDFSTDKNYVTDIKEETKDGKTKLTYKINEKATYNDGTPIDWRAWETTWKINNGKNPAYTPSSTDGYEQIESVTKGANDKEAVVTFERTYPWWQGLFNTIAHPALADPANYNDYLKKLHPEWGAGPFKVESVDFNKGTAVFVPNEKWWGDKPKLDKRIFRQMESKAAVNAFKNGEIDAVGAGSKDDYASVKDMPGVDIRIGRLPKINFNLFNGESDILKDVKVREALADATDRDQLAKIWYQGLPAADGAPGSFALYSFQEGYEDNYSKVAGFDPEKAKQLLDEAGWKEGADGIREKDGKPLSVRYVLVGESEQLNASAKALQQMYKNVGVDMKIEIHPGSEFSKILQSTDFDIFPMAVSDSDPYKVAYFGQFYLSDSGLNRSHTGTPEIDAKIREMQKLPTREEQIKRANEIEVEALASFGTIPLLTQISFAAVKEGLANYGSMAFGDVPLENIGWQK